MKNMKIFIPTYGRHDQQATYNQLPKELKRRTTLVVQRREKHLYENTFPNVAVLPDRIQTISPTRQYISQNLMKGDGKFVMLDDDLRFDTRRKDDSSKFRISEDKDLIELFDAIEKGLDTHAHVGVLAREGGNRVTTKYRECTRMMRVLAYNASALRAYKIRYDRLPLQADFDVTLQLLRKGFKNLVLCDWVNNQGSSNAKGGCSHFRTIKMLTENVKNLASLHPDFIKVVEKQTKTAWNGQARLDVIVQWKQAYESSLK